MSGNNPIPLYFITGFLGSGKTTLLNHILDEARGRGMKLGVIINEWGQVGVDGELVSGSDFEIKELNDGQVFCSCLVVDFIKVLTLYAERDLDAVVVETSGMANPFPLKKLLLDLDRMTKASYAYHGMTALVDPENFLELVDVINAVEEQVLASQRVIINKIDLATPSSVAETRAKLQELNPKAEILETSYGKMADFFAAIGPVKPAAKSLAALGKMAEYSYPRPTNHVIITNERVDPEKAAAFIREILPDALRVKGVLQAESGEWFYVDGVNDRVNYRPVKINGDDAKLVIIPKGGFNLMEQAENAWKKHCGTAFTIK